MANGRGPLKNPPTELQTSRDLSPFSCVKAGLSQQRPSQRTLKTTPNGRLPTSSTPLAPSEVTSLVTKTPRPNADQNLTLQPSRLPRESWGSSGPPGPLPVAPTLGLPTSAQDSSEGHDSSISGSPTRDETDQSGKYRSVLSMGREVPFPESFVNTRTHTHTHTHIHTHTHNTHTHTRVHHRLQ